MNNKIVFDVMYRVNFAISVISNSGNRYFYWFYAKTQRLLIYYLCWYREFLINWYIFEKKLGYGYYWTKAPVADIYFHVRAELKKLTFFVVHAEFLASFDLLLCIQFLSLTIIFWNSDKLHHKLLPYIISR